MTLSFVKPCLIGALLATVVALFVIIAFSNESAESYTIVWDDNNIELIKSVATTLYPVGSILLTRSESLSPSSIAGLEGTTWELIGNGEDYALTSTTSADKIATFNSGSASFTSDEHALTLSEYPSHTHKYSVQSAYESHSHYIDLDHNTLHEFKYKDGGFGVTNKTETTSSADTSEHSHEVHTEKSGGGKAHTHEIVVPYLQFFAWQRIT